MHDCTCPNLSNIVHTDFELGRVIQTVTAADPGITVHADFLFIGNIKIVYIVLSAALESRLH